MLDLTLVCSLPDISKEFLTRMMEAKPVERVEVGVADGEFHYAF